MRCELLYSINRYSGDQTVLTFQTTEHDEWRCSQNTADIQTVFLEAKAVFGRFC